VGFAGECRTTKRTDSRLGAVLVSLQESADKRIMSEAELVPAYFHRLLRLSSQRREFGAQRAPPGERGAGRPPLNPPHRCLVDTCDRRKPLPRPTAGHSRIGNLLALRGWLSQRVVSQEGDNRRIEPVAMGCRPASQFRRFQAPVRSRLATSICRGRSSSRRFRMCAPMCSSCLG